MAGKTPNQKQVIVFIDEDEVKRADGPGKLMGSYFLHSSGFYVCACIQLNISLSDLTYPIPVSRWPEAIPQQSSELRWHFPRSDVWEDVRTTTTFELSYHLIHRDEIEHVVIRLTMIYRDSARNGEFL